MTGKSSVSTNLGVSAVLVIVIIGALTMFAYTSEQNALRDATRQGMESTVGVMATQVNASDIAGLMAATRCPRSILPLHGTWRPCAAWTIASSTPTSSR